MAALDPYAPCPCGSGEKFKWCCQKVESYAERAQRLTENGQLDAALEALDEGLRKHPKNSWLLVRKALVLLNQEKLDEAKGLLRQVIENQPRHVGAHSLLVRLVIETESVDAGVAQFQQALGGTPAELRRHLAPLASLLGALLHEAEEDYAAIRHLELAQRLAGPDQAEDAGRQNLELVLHNPGTPPWAKNRDELAPAPAGLSAAHRDRFEQALARAGEGLWAQAASAFEALSAEKAGPEADRNAGLCRFWVTDDDRGSVALRRYIAALGETDEAVDLEVLCQLYGTEVGEEMVERVQLIWPLRKRDELLATLNESREVQAEGRGPLDPNDENSPEVDHFTLLDRPRVDETSGLTLDRVPRELARVLVGLEIVALEAFDDDGLDALRDRFMALAGRGIPPAHPRTKVIGKVPASARPIAPPLSLPDGIDPREEAQLERENRRHVVLEVWPNTRQPFLKGRTPLEAARAGTFRVPLRAAVMRFELTDRGESHRAAMADLRTRLGLPPEPEFDPETVEISAVPVCRLHLVPAERLNDDRLIALFQRAHEMAHPLAMIRCARAVIDRPALFERGVSALQAYVDLANLAVVEGDREAALQWLERGRKADPASHQPGRNVTWDMHEVELRAQFDPPEQWVPELSIVLDRYQNDQAASRVVLLHLMNMGLVQMVRHPEHPDEMLLDTRRLSAALAAFGPKVTTASGRLGVSAAKGGIWTPGSGEPGGAGGGLWAPGSAAGGTPAGGGGGGGDKPRLIIPGR